MDYAVYVQVELLFLHLFELLADYVAQDFGVVVDPAHL